MVSRNDAGRASTAQGGGIEVPAPGLFRSPYSTENVGHYKLGIFSYTPNLAEASN